MRCFPKFVFILLFFISLRSEAQETDLNYTISRKDSVTLSIKVVFNGNMKGSSMLHLPHEWAGQQSLFKAVSDIKPLSTQTIVMPTDRPYNYTLKYKPGSKVAFSYLLRKDWTGLLRYPLYFRPVIEPDFFYFEGYSGLVYPELADTVNVRCHLVYEGFSTNDFIGNSFYANAKAGSFTVSIDNLLNSIFCAGNFRSKTIAINGRKIVIALTGKPAFEDEAAFTNISKIILAERRFWNDAGPAYYFTVFLPLYDQGNTGGTAFYHAFSLFQSKELGLTGNLLPMIAHEYFHNWLGLGLKMPEPDEPYKWFSEGFTEYYSYKILYQTGAISKDDFLTRINGYLKDYYLSRYFNLSNNELIGRYWENRELKLLSYRRGLILAFLLDSRIAEKNHKSLDDLLRTLYTESKPSMVFSNDKFNKLVNSFSDSITLAAANQCNVGNNAMLGQLLFASKLYHMDTLRVNKVFDLGFDYESSKAAGKIVGLTSGSNAAKAGLTENMELTEQCSIWFNNTEKPAVIGVTDSGKERAIQYIPVRSVDIKIPQVSIEK